MMVTQTDVFSVPARKGTMLTVAETGAASRTFAFTNRKGAAITVSMEESADGVTWSALGSPFAVGPVGCTTATVVKDTDSPNRLRIRASGGQNYGELDLTYMRVKDSQQIWS